MNTTLTLPARNLPFDCQWDVVVLGGGPAGCAAAAGAARAGAKTLLIERNACLGGMGTAALVPAWCPFGDGQRFIYSGIAREVLDKSKAGTPHEPADKIDWVSIDAEHLKRLYDDLVEQAGASILFETSLVDCVRDEAGTVQAVIVASKAGLTAIGARVFIDATGDADLAFRAGAAFEKGDENGHLMSTTHCFVIANVDVYAYHYQGRLRHGCGKGPELIDRVLASGRYPRIPDRHCCNSLVGPGAVGFNAGHLDGVDATDPFSVSRAMIEGRRMAKDYRDAFAEVFPAAFANGWLAVTGSVMGVRETRRIVGDYMLTADDWLARRSFPDEICRNAYFIDIHTRGGAQQEVKQAAIEKTFAHYGPGESHGIPYRCLTPPGLRNLLVAGRCISTERNVNGSVRVMPVCLSTGEAAGVAAAMAAAVDADVHAVDVQLLRAHLRRAGAWLPEPL